MKSLKEEIEIFCINSRLKSNTLRKYSSCLKKFASYLAKKMDIDEEEVFLNKVYLEKDLMGIPIRYLPLDSNLVEEYLKSLISRGYYTIHSHHSSLNSFFTFLARNYSFQNPFDSLEFRLADYYPEKKYSRILTRSGIIKFLNSLITNTDNLETELLLFIVLLSTGCRISEVLGLQYRDLDAINDSFRLNTTKNNDQAIVNLRPGIGQIIDIYASTGNRYATDYIFLNKENKKYSRAKVDDLFQNYLRLAKLPPMNLHGLRHTFSTLMADEDTPITVLQQLLRHKDIKSTMDYINPHYVRNKNFAVKENQLVLDGLKKILSGR